MRGDRRQLAEAVNRNTEAMARSDARWVELINEQRQFTRDITRRNEVVWRGVMEELRAGRDALLELRDEIKADTKAVLALLDRFENGGASSA